MKKEKINILVIGLLKTGSSALADILREYDNINVLPGEFNDFRAPGMVADQLSSNQDKDFPNQIGTVLKVQNKIALLYQILPIFNWKKLTKNQGIGDRLLSSIIRIRQLSLLKQLNKKLLSHISTEEKIRYANQWIIDVGNVHIGNRQFAVFNQPILSSIDTCLWKKVFHPCKLIIVYRDPRDQLADIMKRGILYKIYGAPVVNFGGITLETIYGRSRNAAIAIHVDAIKKRFEWIDSLTQELDSAEFLLIDFEGLINNYDKYTTVIENFVGTSRPRHKKRKLNFDPNKAKKNIGIYGQYLNGGDLESLDDLVNWYKNSLVKHQFHRVQAPLASLPK